MAHVILKNPEFQKTQAVMKKTKGFACNGAGAHRAGIAGSFSVNAQRLKDAGFDAPRVKTRRYQHALSHSGQRVILRMCACFCAG